MEHPSPPPTKASYLLSALLFPPLVVYLAGWALGVRALGWVQLWPGVALGLILLTVALYLAHGEDADET